MRKFAWRYFKPIFWTKRTQNCLKKHKPKMHKKLEKLPKVEQTHVDDQKLRENDTKK